MNKYVSAAYVHLVLLVWYIFRADDLVLDNQVGGSLLGKTNSSSWQLWIVCRTSSMNGEPLKVSPIHAGMSTRVQVLFK